MPHDAASRKNISQYETVRTPPRFEERGSPTAETCPHTELRPKRPDAPTEELDSLRSLVDALQSELNDARREIDRLREERTDAAMQFGEMLVRARDAERRAATAESQLAGRCTDPGVLDGGFDEDRPRDTVEEPPRSLRRLS